MIVEAIDEPVHHRRSEFGRAANGIHQDQDLRGFLEGDPLKDCRFPAVRSPELLRRVPGTGGAAEDQRQTLRYEGQPLALPELAQAIGLAEPDLRAFRPRSS